MEAGSNGELEGGRKGGVEGGRKGGVEEGMEVEVLRARLREHRQGHLLHFWADLCEAEQHSLYTELAGLDLPALNTAFECCMEDGGESAPPASSLDERLSPLPDSVLGSVTRTDPATLRLYEHEGRLYIC